MKNYIISSNLLPVLPWSRRRVSVLSIWLAAFILAGIVTTVLGQSVGIGDPGFEQPVLADGTFVQREEANGGAWIFANYPTTQGAGLTRPPSPFTSLLSPEGQQVALLQSLGRFHQSISFTEGGLHLLSFQIASRQQSSSSGYGGNLEYEVRLDDVPLHREITSSGASWSTREIPFSVTAGIHTLSFVGLTSEDNTAFFDQIVITRQSNRYRIEDLYNTGVVSNDLSGLQATLLAPGTPDAHWRLGGVAAVAFTQHPAWRGNGPNSSWIGFDGSNETAEAGDYFYETTFTLPPSANPETVRLSGMIVADNGYEIFINETSTGLIYNQDDFFPEFRYFLIPPGGAPFVRGQNTLRIKVTNTPAPSPPNPTGLRVEQLRGEFETDSSLEIPITDLQTYPAMELRWSGVPGQRYRVQFSGDLGGGWQNLSEEIAGASGLIRFYVSTTENMRRFYRVLSIP